MFLIMFQIILFFKRKIRIKNYSSYCSLIFITFSWISLTNDYLHCFLFLIFLSSFSTYFLDLSRLYYLGFSWCLFDFSYKFMKIFVIVFQGLRRKKEKYVEKTLLLWFLTNLLMDCETQQVIQTSLIFSLSQTKAHSNLFILYLFS